MCKKDRESDNIYTGLEYESGSENTRAKKEKQGIYLPSPTSTPASEPSPGTAPKDTYGVDGLKVAPDPLDE